MRSHLFVPGNDERKLLKSSKIAVDALIVDWEDSVLSEHKAFARNLTKSLLRQGGLIKPFTLIRLNSVSTPDFEADCDALRGIIVGGVLLSKCDSATDIQALDNVLDRNFPERQVQIYALIESAAGIVNASAIAASSRRLKGLAFGAEDFCADTGISRTPGEIELLYARSVLVTTSRAFRLQAIDSPCMNVKDEAKLKFEAQAARNLGFTGKLAIHPSQVPILNEIFTPNRQEIERARKIVEAFSASGSGVITHEGSVVDEAVVRGARQILDMAK